MTPQSTKADTIQQLQRQILAMQGLSRPSGADTVKTGLGALEQAFPNQTFPLGAVHEFTSTVSMEPAITDRNTLAGIVRAHAAAKDIAA